MRTAVAILVCALAAFRFGGVRASPYNTEHGRRDMEITNLRKPKSPSRSAFQVPTLKPDYVPTYEANRHYESMQERTRCRQPRPVVVEVQKSYTNSSIEYLPSCTILHRCDIQAGCCGRGHTCLAQRKEPIDLYFYAIPVNKTQKHSSDVLKLSFTNHTVCACEEDLTPVAVTSDNSNTAANSNDNDELSDDDFIPEHRCPRCPEPFKERVLDDEQCTCDCFDKDHKCIAIKKGRKTMPQKDARCVRRLDCAMPLCSTGSFDARTGRCPLLEQRKHRHARQRRHHWEGVDENELEK